MADAVIEAIFSSFWQRYCIMTLILFSVKEGWRDMSTRFSTMAAWALFVAGVFALLVFATPAARVSAQTNCAGTALSAPQNLRILAASGLEVPLTAQASRWPDATNTGYKNAPGYPGSLTPWTGGAIQSNHTYSFIDFGTIDVGSRSNPVSNVTFYGCRFKAIAVGQALVVLYGDNITFDYSSFEPGVSVPPTPYNKSYQFGIVADGGYYSFAQLLTVTHSDFWGFGNAIAVDGSTQAKPHVFRDNWIHDAADDGGGTYHTDGIGSLSGSGRGSHVVIDHNTIESLGNTNGIAFQAGTYSNFTITNNLFGGFGYTVVVWAANGAPNTIFTGNTFSTRLPVVWGPLYPQPFWQNSGSVWCQNKWMVPTGAAWGSPTHDGWFWIPNTTGNRGSSDTPFVSQTDYSQ
jgi:hypothetical protein